MTINNLDNNNYKCTRCAGNVIKINNNLYKCIKCELYYSKTELKREEIKRIKEKQLKLFDNKE